MIYSTAMTSEVSNRALGHLLREDRQEDLCFALWHPSQGAERMTALVGELILPSENERAVHGNVEFLSNYFERALDLAVSTGSGLALMHSHLGPGWQGMSSDDVEAERGHAASVKGATGFPFLGLTAGTDEAWSARFWEKTAPRTYERRWCQTVRVVGGKMSLTYHDEQLPEPGFRPELERTVSAWGKKSQADLARLRVGIVGAGSVGGIVAEALARMGVKDITLMDFDGVEVVNLDRLLHGKKIHAEQKRAKVDVLAEALRESATAEDFKAHALEYSVCEEEGYRAALDCDVLFSCVDRPWPRNVLNCIAYAHLIPVIDGGIQVQTKKKGAALRSADWRAHVAAPGRQCMECLGQFTPDLVSLERAGSLDDPSYILGLSEDHPARRNQNVFAFSLSVASFEVLQFLSMLVVPPDFAKPGAQMYHFVQADLDTDCRGCKTTCPYPGLTATGDHMGITVTGEHAMAVKAREERLLFTPSQAETVRLPRFSFLGLREKCRSLFRKRR